MRDLKTLINTMIPFIPEEEFEDIILDLKSIISSVEYCSPEMRGFWFDETCKVLHCLPPVGKDAPIWLKTVYCIFTEQQYKDLDEFDK